MAGLHKGGGRLARPPKEGLGYFPLDVDFLGDKKVKLLKAEFGAAGVLVFLAILAEIYRNNGYYMRWDRDDCLLMAEEIGCGLTPAAMEEIVQGCVRRSLFDQRVANVFGVLTSSGIQRRYLRAAAERSNIDMMEEYFLLDASNEKDVPKGILKKLALKKVSRSKNPCFPVEKPNYSEDLSLKKSKVKERKVKERKVVVAGAENSDAGRATTTVPSLKEILLFCKEEKLNISPERFFNVNEARNWLTNQGLPISDWKALAREWNRTERPKTAPAGRGRAAGRQRGAAAYEPSAWAGYEEE